MVNLFTINSMYTRQSNLYFSKVKIKNFKHVYMQKKYQSSKISLKMSIIKKLLGLEALRGVQETSILLLSLV